MSPAHPQGSVVLVLRWAYRTVTDVSRGDVVAYAESREGKTYVFVWRVVGLPGDTVEVAGTDVRVNGQALPRRKLREEPQQVVFEEKSGDTAYEVAYEKQPKEDRRKPAALSVPAGEVFVLGDNRDNALDSRFTRTVAFHAIIGKVIW
jgi:signal peptidase I